MSTEVTDEPWWWISFQDIAQRKGERFVACAMVRGKNRSHVLERMKRHGLVPKATTLHATAIQIPKDKEYLVREQLTYRLLTKDEAVTYARLISN